jgi:cell division protein FtsL
MKKLFYLTMLEKIMLSLLIVLVSLLAFSSYEEKHKYGNFINNIQNCSEDSHFHPNTSITSQD